MNTLLEAEHLTKVFAQRGKEPFKAVDDVSFSLQAGETWNRWRIRLRKKYTGEDDHKADGYYRWYFEIPGKRHYEIETEPVEGRIWKYPDGFSESGRFL